MKTVRILVEISLVFALDCSAPPPPFVQGNTTIGGRGTGGGPACFCDIRGWSKGGIPRVDLPCFCEQLGCPVSSQGLERPSLAMKLTMKCNGRTSYRSSMELAGTNVYTFDDKTDTLVGASNFVDVNVLCEQNEMTAGEPLDAGNACGATWCLKSWGADQVAPEGGCLDLSTLVDPRYSEPRGSGGQGGFGGSLGEGGALPVAPGGSAPGGSSPQGGAWE
jgi:hypothetical protein